MQVMAEHQPTAAPARKPIAFALTALGVLYMWHTTLYLFAAGSSEDWPTIARAFAMSVWFPFLLVPFVYAVAFLMTCESILTMLPFFNGRKRLLLRVTTATIIGCRFSLRLASGFTGQWRNRMGQARQYGEARGLMAEYRSSVRTARSVHRP